MSGEDGFAKFTEKGSDLPGHSGQDLLDVCNSMSHGHRHLERIAHRKDAFRRDESHPTVRFGYDTSFTGNSGMSGARRDTHEEAQVAQAGLDYQA